MKSYSQFHLEILWIRSFKDSLHQIDWTTPVACSQLLEVFRQLSPYAKLTLWKTIHGIQSGHVTAMTRVMAPAIREAFLLPVQ